MSLKKNIAINLVNSLLRKYLNLKNFSLLLRIVLLHMDGKLVMMMKNFVYGIIDVVGFVYLQLIFHLH